MPIIVDKIDSEPEYTLRQQNLNAGVRSLISHWICFSMIVPFRDPAGPRNGSIKTTRIRSGNPIPISPIAQTVPCIMMRPHSRINLYIIAPAQVMIKWSRHCAQKRMLP